MKYICAFLLIALLLLTSCAAPKTTINTSTELTASRFQSACVPNFEPTKQQSGPLAELTIEDEVVKECLSASTKETCEVDRLNNDGKIDCQWKATNSFPIKIVLSLKPMVPAQVQVVLDDQVLFNQTITNLSDIRTPQQITLTTVANMSMMFKVIDNISRNINGYELLKTESLLPRQYVLLEYTNNETASNFELMQNSEII